MNLPEIEGAHSHRVFFALWPDAEVMSHLAALGHSLASPGSRPMRPHSLHLTLAFLGSVTSAQLARLLLIAEGIRGEAFEFGLDRLGFWPRHGSSLGRVSANAAAPAPTFRVAIAGLGGCRLFACAS
jgi:2'-5' RNA ligase